MTLNARRRLVLMAAVTAALGAPVTGRAQTSHLLTAADIERISGLTGVHVVSQTAPGSVPGQDNYADGSGRIVLWVHEFPAQYFQRAKARPAKVMNTIVIEPKLFHAAVPGIGDEAFDSPDGPSQRAIYVRKGGKAFALTANVISGPSGDRLTVTMAQLKTLAMLAASRLG